MIRRGFLASSASGAAPSNPPNARIVYTEPAITPVRPRMLGGVYFVVNTLQRVVAARVDDEEDREHQEHRRSRTRRGRCRAAPTSGCRRSLAASTITAPSSAHGHHRSAGYPWNSAFRVAAVVNPSWSSTSGGIRQPDQDVPPGHQEADGRVQAARRVGGHRSRGRHLPGQQADAHRRRTGTRSARRRPRAAASRWRRRRSAGIDAAIAGAGGHVGDALERDLTQADGVPPQASSWWWQSPSPLSPPRPEPSRCPDVSSRVTCVTPGPIRRGSFRVPAVIKAPPVPVVWRRQEPLRTGRWPCPTRCLPGPRFPR